MTQLVKQAHVRTTFLLTAALMFSSIGAAQTALTTAANTTGSDILAQLRPSVRQAPATATPITVPVNPTMVMDDRGLTCCPAVMQGTFSQYFRYHQLPGKNITQSYGLEFLSTFNYPGTETIPQTLTLDQQMMPFAFYIGSTGAGILPSGYVANSVILRAEIREITTPTGPNGTPTSNDWNQPSAIASSTGTPAVRAWWAGIMPPSTNPYNVWDGSGGVSGFHTEYMDGRPHLSPTYLLPNHTYMMKMSLVLAYKKTPNDDTWFIKDINCSSMRGPFWWNVRDGNLKTAPGATAQPQIQFNEVK
ncbi:hypothetical protein [Deinococcus sp. AJ005]|uniref:hypothetical protein n=1 Tax=Deinococcus sp. AJ005 TaxID=2652443 RepID=UPI00125CC302|nr:hypothetical protein [Deinococcus sp. AJ005]QFP75646.1 hypothetical protein DAAJ005_03615 [Deinococcus sp. AJ005]